MPILSAFRDRPEPLGQGDLLHEVRLFVSDGDQALALPETSALVISRDCSAMRDRLVSVLPVKRWKGTPPKDLGSKELSDFLASLRDGVSAPDVFYLGSLEGEGTPATRYQAKLDVMCALQLPADEPGRGDWIRQRRIARLEPDFVRSLPVRLFQSVARVGFDDQAWYSTGDLEWVVAQADAELAQIEAEVMAKRANAHRSRVADPGNVQRIQASEREVKDLEKRRDDLSDRFSPLRSELRRRSAGP